jgi:16S rRNA C967 or C1407 C5-methylase (RsmB/RsmF family)
MVYESYPVNEKGEEVVEAEITPREISPTPQIDEKKKLKESFYRKKLSEFRAKSRYLESKGIKGKEKEKILRELARRYNEEFERKYKALEMFKRRKEEEMRKVVMSKLIAARNKIQEKLRKEKMSVAERMSLEKQLDELNRKIKKIREFYEGLGYGGLI